MPIEILEIADGPGACFRCHGVVTSRELIAATRRLLAHPRLSAYRFGIVDHCDAVEVRYESAELRELADLDLKVAAIARPKWPVAVVAPEDLQFGFSRMWQALCDETGWQTQVFRTRLEADEWVRSAAMRDAGPDVA